jgi:glycosyltransferase involved in cell wall biosynthesis
MEQPKVAVLTSTKNRGHLLALQVALMKAQTYPQHLITWVIVDSSEKDENSWLNIQESEKEGNSFTVLYMRADPATPLGTSRNISLEIARELDVAYVLFWDDDDLYSPGRISYSVETLENELPQVQVAGCNASVLLLREKRIYECESHRHPLISNYYTHAIESYMIVKKSYILGHSFDGEATCTVMPPFLEGFEVPIAPLDRDKVALMIGHDKNTYDKYKYFGRPGAIDHFYNYSIEWEDLKEWWLTTDELFGLFMAAFQNDF